MGFNKIVLPEHSVLNRMNLEDPDGTYRWIRRADAFIGSSRSIKKATAILRKKSDKCLK